MNTFRCLLYTLLVFLTTYATADITIDGETVHVETDNYKVQFDKGIITQIHNKQTSETYTLPLDPHRQPGFRIGTGVLGRDQLGKHKRFWARLATTIETKKISPNQVEILFREGKNEIRFIITIDPNNGDLLISGDGVSDTPGVYGIQWGIENLDISNLRLIIPSERRQVYDAASAITHLNIDYPSTFWEAQLAIIEAERGGFYVRGTDPTFQFKRLNYQSTLDSFGIGFLTYNQAPWDALTSAKSITWRFNTYAGDWCIPAQIYRDWMDETFDPWRLSEAPAWVNNIGLVVILPNLNKEVFKLLAKLTDPTKTLFYVTDWRKGGHDINHPDYSNPHEKFEGVLEAARQHGFRVMLHVNIHNCSPSHPLYPEFKKYQYRHPQTGELSGWKWDEIDHPQRNAHINPASSRWRNLLVQQFKAVWDKYKVDAFFLDTTHYVVNDANGLIDGLTSAQGNFLLHKQLVEAMPGIVLSGEHVHEVTFFRENFARRGTTQGPLHPISTFLFEPYTRIHGGIAMPSTRDSSLYHTYLNTAEGQGYLPTLWIWKQEILDIPLTQQILAVARRWQQLGLRTDVSCDWSPNTLFQYTTQTGETVIHNGSVLVMDNPDLNRDGKVNVLDLIFISNKLGQQVPEATLGDLNGDGVINILDLMLVSQSMTNAP